MSLHVSIDFGTSSTCTVVSMDGAEPQVVVIDGQPLVPSAVFAAPDGTLFTGHEAERHAAVDPARFEPHPKRRIDEGELLLGSTVLKVSEAIHAVLRRAVGEARRFAGGREVDLLVLTHPADWGSVRIGQLRQAAATLGNEIALVPEPVAAAVFHSAGNGLPDGGALAVLDLGGGTVDASVVRKHGNSFQVPATRGEPNFGGADIDQMLLEHIGKLVGPTDSAAWQRLVEGRELADRRRRRVLRQDVRNAKETLSRHTYTDVPLPPPFSDAHLTRIDLEGMISGPLGKAVDLVATALRDGNIERGQLAGVFLVGGSSRIPLVSRLIHERIGVVPTTLDQPETVVARGALRAVRLDPQVPGGLSPLAAPDLPPRQPGDSRDFSLSRVRTVVIGGNDPTVQVKGPARRRFLPWLIGGGVAVLAAAGIAAGLLIYGGGRPTAQPVPPPQQVLRYDYGFTLPGQWHHNGGDPAKFQTLLVPATGPQDSVIAVEEGRLAFDTDSDRNRAVQLLRDEYEKSVAAGGTFSRFNPAASFAGRDVVYYQETLPESTVEWYTIYQRQFKVSVGCKYGATGKDDVIRACEQVIGSLRIG